LKKIPVNHYLDTLNCKGSKIKYMCSITLSPLRRDFEFQVNCLVLDEIEQQMPSEPIEVQHLKIPKHLPLADPSFHMPGRIDMLIGGEWFWRLLCIGQIEINKQGLVLQKTKLGWIVGGPTYSQIPKSIKCNLSNVKSPSNIDMQLRKFWELESIDDKAPTSQDETNCEQHFIQTYKRDDNGRFVVSIPFKIDPKQLGESRSVAVRRLISLEKRFLKDKNFKASYCAFMQEYEELGHMTNIQETSHDRPTFYMPHHGVLRPASTSTKLRVVFDGSIKSDNGLSLNDCQSVGPVVQEELFSILIRFRQHPYVVCADIQKMYRQVLVSPSDRPLQRILWRTDPKEEMKTYELNTLTYGTSSASYLAIRSLMQLANECEQSQPDVARIIRSNFYVDDLLTGFDNVEEAKAVVQKLHNVLLSGCLPLAKWASNEPSIISNVVDKENKLSTISL
ncbi:PREDICTED: uncharacterized protein LOC108780429, partial [Cyphomyrmex costatus]|uniref:uncharacterized protein LOC108780429 n=1 Tax=Cyphomyrmex costatus TaxID=456900 RepID=UPI0008522123